MKQKFKLISDVHVEFLPYFQAGEMGDSETVLLIAGDFNNYGESMLEFIRQMSIRFKAVCFIAGNHEYYSFNRPMSFIEREFESLNHKYHNVHYLQGGAFVRFGDVSVIGATLWTDFRKMNPQVLMGLEHGYNDYEYILKVVPDKDRFGRSWGKKLVNITPQDIYELHKDHLAGIIASCESEKMLGQKCIVMTHHGCSYMSIHEKFLNHPKNACYVTELFDLIYDELQPAYWCHGHCHTPVNYMINKTNVISNPAGYRHNPADKNKEFDQHFKFEV